MAIFSELWKVDLGHFGMKLFLYRSRVFQHESVHSMSLSVQQNTEAGGVFQSFEIRLLLLFGNILIVLFILRCMNSPICS